MQVALPEQGPLLKTLHMTINNNPAFLLRHLTNLKELRINSLNEKAFEVLATNCKDLEVLEWIQNPPFIEESFGRPPHDALHQFLVSCSSLKVFNGIERFVKADDIIREPWACQGIEKLRCRIVGIERLTQAEQVIHDRVVAANPRYLHSDVSLVMSELTDKERAVVQKLQRSREQQRQVYERLTSLKHLKHLDLGYENRHRSLATYISEIGGEEYLRYRGPTPDTLELSLESGLGLLDTLEDLEMFGFEA
ncbi:hypothetical protein BGZ65_012840, partial [Modicella reniformis]